MDDAHPIPVTGDMAGDVNAEELISRLMRASRRQDLTLGERLRQSGEFEVTRGPVSRAD
jgi:hypothetical protein